MALYKLKNLLRATEPKEFDSDKQAWNSLRKTWKKEDGTISGVFITLWKEVKIVVPLNDEENYVEEHNSLYGPRPYGYGPDDAKLMKVGEPNIISIWIPVLQGITDREYKIIKYEEE